MKSRIATTAFVLVLCSGVAMAQDALYEGHMNHIDTNDNGAVNRQEYQAFMADAFNKLDADRDGNLSSDEVGRLLTADQVSSMDRNGNGMVSRTEFMNQVMTDFASADKDGDGRLQ